MSDSRYHDERLAENPAMDASSVQVPGARFLICKGNNCLEVMKPDR